MEKKGIPKASGPATVQAGGLGVQLRTEMPSPASLATLNRAVQLLDSEGKVKKGTLNAREWTNFMTAFTYDTNAMEGSRITRGEVDAILLSNAPVEGSMTDISETRGVAAALSFLVTTDEHVSTRLMRELHGTVFRMSVFPGNSGGPGRRSK